MIFRKTVWRLTLAYSLIQLLLFAAVALGVYAFVTLKFDFDTTQADGSAAMDTAGRAFAGLRVALVGVFAVLLAVVPIVSYFMARVALRPLRRNYENQERFVDAVSHELRTPLGVAVGEMELALMRPRTVAEYRAAIQGSLDAVGTLTQLADSLVVLTQNPSEHQPEAFEHLDVAKLIAAVVVECASKNPSVSVVVRTVPDGLAIRAMPGLARLALHNVVENAKKFSADGGVVEIRASEHDRHVSVVIVDRGVGMSAGEVDRAGERFWRADRARSTPGQGLGLSLVAHIVELHGGSMEIASAEGTGTTVTTRWRT